MSWLLKQIQAYCLVLLGALVTYLFSMWFGLVDYFFGVGDFVSGVLMETSCCTSFLVGFGVSPTKIGALLVRSNEECCRVE